MVEVIISGVIVAVMFISVLVIKLKFNEEDYELFKGGLMIGLFSGFSLLLFIMATANYLEGDVPSALDVYRGNTELKVTKTVVNGSIIGCDTTVIFNDNL